MTPPAKRNDDARKDARRKWAEDRRDHAKESQRREDEARRNQEKGREK